MFINIGVLVVDIWRKDVDCFDQIIIGVLDQFICWMMFCFGWKIVECLYVFDVVLYVWVFVVLLFLFVFIRDEICF